MKLEETLVSLEKKGEREGECRVKLQSSGNILIIICAKFVFKVDWRLNQMAEKSRVDTSKQGRRNLRGYILYIYNIYCTIYATHICMYVCLPHILDVAGGHWCGNFINRLQQIVRNLWTRFAAKKLSEILAKKKLIALLCSEFVPEFFFSFVFSLLGKCKQMKSAATVNGASDKRNCRGRSPRGVLARVASSNGNWSNWNALLMATKIVNLWTSRGNWSKWFKTTQVCVKCGE